MELNQLSVVIKSLWKPLLALAVAILVMSWIWGFFNQGTLKLNISPTPASALVGRSTYSIQGRAEIKLNSGTYPVLIRKDGYSDYETSVTIKSRETAELSVNLVKSPVEIVSFARIPTISSDGAGILFLGADSRIYRSRSVGGVQESVSEPIFSDPTYLSWSPDRSKLLVTMLNNKPQLQQAGSPFYSAGDANLTEVTWVYELDSRKITKVVAGAVAAAWTSDGRGVFYVTSDTSPALYQLNLGGTATRIANIESKNPILRPSPDGKHLAWYDPPEGYGASDINLINLSTSLQEPLTKNGYSVGVSWSPDSRKVIVDKIGQESRETALLVVNMSDKSFKEISRGGGAENSVWGSGSNLIYSFDTASKSIVRVNVESGVAAKIAKLADLTPSNFFIDVDGENLYFTSNDTLYRLGFK